MIPAFTECRALTESIRAKTGELVGFAVKQGLFAVTSTRKEGRKFVTTHLTGWQSHGECMDFMRKLAA